MPLLDMLTETALRTGCLDAFTPAGTRGDIAAATLFQRLLLTVYAYWTNTGIRAVAAASTATARTSCAMSGAALTVEWCRPAARVIANATFAARRAWLWGDAPPPWRRLD